MEKQEYVLDTLELIPEDFKGNLVLYNDCPIGRAIKRRWPELKWMERGVKDGEVDVTSGSLAFGYSIKGREYQPVVARLNGEDLPLIARWSSGSSVFTEGWGAANVSIIEEAIRNKTFKSAQVEFKEITKTT